MLQYQLLCLSFFLLFAILIGIGASTNILIAQAFGAKNREGLSSVISNSLTITLIISAIIGIIGFLISYPVLKIINTPANIFSNALTYFQIYTLSMPINALMNWIMGITRGLGNSKFSFYFSITLLILKIILTPIFILGFYFIPKMGVSGAIISSVIIEITLLAISIPYLAKKYEIIKSSLKFSLDMKTIIKFITIGFPASLQMIIVSLSATVLMGFISSFGEKTIAVFGIGNRIDQFAFLPALSLGMALTVISSQNLSANKESRVMEFLKWSILLSLGISLLVVIVVNVFSQNIFFFFINNKEITEMGIQYLRIMSVSYLLMGLVFSVQGIIRGAGDTLAVLLIKSISMIAIRIPVAYLLAFVLYKSPNGIWASFPVVMAFEIIASWIYLKSENWKKKIVFRKQTEEVIT